MKSARFRPAGIGSRNSKTIVPGPPQDAVRRPVDAGVGRHQVRRQAEIAVEAGDARLVVAGDARLAAVALREDQQLAAPRPARSWPSRTILRSAAAPPSRSITTIRCFQAYQPKNGMQHQLLAHHEAGVGQPTNWAKTSNMHWCLAATSARPVGMCSRPRISTRMPQMTRSSTITPRAQNLNARPRSSGAADSSGRQHDRRAPADHR